MERKVTEEEIKKFYAKDVCIVCNEGEELTGFFCTFTYADDNEDGEGASITIENDSGLYEIFVREIASIRLAG